MVGGTWILVSLAGCEIHWVLALASCILAYNFIHKKRSVGVWLMGGCRLLLWASASTCGEGEEIFPLTWIFGSALALYIVGISRVEAG